MKRPPHPFRGLVGPLRLDAPSGDCGPSRATRARVHAAANQGEGPDGTRVEPIPQGQQGDDYRGDQGASAALAGEEAGHDPTSSAGAEEAQPRPEAVPDRAPACKAAGLTRSVWERFPAVVREHLIESWPVFEARGPLDAARRLLEARALREAHASDDGVLRVISKAEVRLEAAALRMALRAGLLVRRGELWGVAPHLATGARLAFAVNPVLALLDVRVAPDGERPSLVMQKCLLRWGVPRAWVLTLGRGEALALQRRLMSRRNDRVLTKLAPAWGCPRFTRETDGAWEHELREGRPVKRKVYVKAKLSLETMLQLMGPRRWHAFEVVCRAGEVGPGHEFERGLALLRFKERRELRAAVDEFSAELDLALCLAVRMTPYHRCLARFGVAANQASSASLNTVRACGGNQGNR